MAYQEEPPHPDVTGVAWHYGEPLSEQRAITSTGAIVGLRVLGNQPGL